MALRTTLSQRTLKTLIHYDGRNGLITWLVDRGRNAKAGDEAGTSRPDGMIGIMVSGKTYLAQRLIWLYVHGHFPEGRLKFQDGDPSNLKLSNIIEEKNTLLKTPEAVARRAYRARLKTLHEAE